MFLEKSESLFIKINLSYDDATLKYKPQSLS